MANIYGKKPNIKLQWEKVKDAPFKEKAEWCVQYFGLYALIAVAVIVIISALTVTVIRNKQPELINIFCWDAMFENQEDKALLEALAEKLGKDPAKEKLTLNGALTDEDASGYYVYQREAIFARVAGKTLDIVAGREDGLNGFLNPEEPGNSIFTTLDEVISAESYNALLECGRIRFVELSDGTSAPYFINIAGSRLAQILNISSEAYCIGISCTAPHPESIEALLKIVLETS